MWKNQWPAIMANWARWLQTHEMMAQGKHPASWQSEACEMEWGKLNLDIRIRAGREIFVICCKAQEPWIKVVKSTIVVFQNKLLQALEMNSLRCYVPLNKGMWFRLKKLKFASLFWCVLCLFSAVFLMDSGSALIAMRTEMLFRKSNLPSRGSGKGYMCREPTFKPYDYSAIGVGSHPRSPQGAGEGQTKSPKYIQGIESRLRAI